MIANINVLGPGAVLGIGGRSIDSLVVSIDDGGLGEQFLNHLWKCFGQTIGRVVFPWTRSTAMSCFSASTLTTHQRIFRHLVNLPVEKNGRAGQSHSDELHTTHYGVHKKGINVPGDMPWN